MVAKSGKDIEDKPGEEMGDKLGRTWDKLGEGKRDKLDGWYVRWRGGLRDK